MKSELEGLVFASLDPDKVRIEASITLIKNQQAENGNRLVAGVFDRFWQQMLDTSKSNKLNVALKVNQPDGSSYISQVNPEKVSNLNRKDALWRGTTVDSGTDEVFVILTRTSQENGRNITTSIKVSPFTYTTENGAEAYKLKPDEIMIDNPSRGAIYRNKATI
jgi:hypothetical protein